jgi:hypothetical protein
LQQLRFPPKINVLETLSLSFQFLEPKLLGERIGIQRFHVERFYHA